ncbi:MAG: hypothetical protein GXO97_01215 [Nitrospirae bacterium]|nr:hypothetical protein [Nitrospirota bacterium]
MLLNAGLDAAIADPAEMKEAMEEKPLFDAVLAGQEIEDKEKMRIIKKTIDVIEGNTLYAHSYLEM